MHLCFVDESGTPAKPDRDRPKFFVIAGLIVPEGRWHVLSARMRGLKSRKKYRGEFKWRFFAPDNADDSNPMHGWTQSDKNALRDEVFGLVTSDKSIRIVAGVCEQQLAYKLPTITNQEDIYFHTYKVVTERFQYFLQDVSKASGHRTLGIIVGDHRGKGDDDNLRTQHQRLITESRQYTSTYENLVEGLFLAPSHLSVGIQLVDMVAVRFGAVSRPGMRGGRIKSPSHSEPTPKARSTDTASPAFLSGTGQVLSSKGKDAG
jgi:hypothetical protein